MTRLNNEIKNTEEYLKAIPDIFGRNLFIEVHRLTSVPPSAMNCDGNGDIKKVTYGGYERTIFSAASLKRPLREMLCNAMDNSKFGPLLVYQDVKTMLPNMSEEYKEALLMALLMAFTAKGNDTKKELRKTDFHVSDKKSRYATDQLLPLSKESRKLIAEKAVEIFTEENCKVDILFKDSERNNHQPGDLTLTEVGEERVAKLVKEVKKCLAEERLKLGLGEALYGGMSTSPLVASTNNATQFAYSIGVNENSGDIDYFTGVDTFKKNLSIFDEDFDDAINTDGAGHLGTREISADCMYSYNNYDLRTLIENTLKGCDWSDVAEIKKRLKVMVDHLLENLEANLLVLPKGKRNAMFAVVDPDVVYVTCTKTIPRSKANLYERPVRATNSSTSVSEIAAKRLAESINTPPLFRTEHTKQYWLSNQKYGDFIENEGVEKTNAIDMIEDLRKYLYAQFGIDA